MASSASVWHRTGKGQIDVSRAARGVARHDRITSLLGAARSDHVAAWRGALAAALRIWPYRHE